MTSKNTLKKSPKTEACLIHEIEKLITVEKILSLKIMSEHKTNVIQNL